MKRGEICLVTGGGDYLSKPRPAVIVRADAFTDLSSVTVCGFTTTILEDVTIRVDVAPDKSNGLDNHSQIMVDKITTTEKRRLRRRLGHLRDDQLNRLDQALLLYLGISRRTD